MGNAGLHRCVVIAATAAALVAYADNARAFTADNPLQRADVQLIAAGIPGAGAICQIGTFHTGGPFVSNAAFAAQTQPGAILDGVRLLVASSSNFGAALYRTDQAPGAVLSIDPNGAAVMIPADFAAAGGQVSIPDSRVMLYTANNAAFVNSMFSSTAATQDEVAASNPTGISLNNAFGRPWIANAPFGDHGYGTESVDDPGGMPFKGAPDPVAGGVFAGTVTNRNAASQHGLVAPAVGTALLTKSPDQSGRAVFAVALADGSVVQIHVQQGVDLLASPGTFTPLTSTGTAAAESTDPHALNRVGLLFNWVPTRIVYIADPLANRIVALDISDSGSDPDALFTVTNVRYLSSPVLNLPVDLAPTMVEGAARNFASNTTLGGGADLYILNRGDNTIVRMSQDGDVLAVRSIDGALPGMRVAGIATSDDGRTLYVTATLPGGDGVVLATPAFGQGDVTALLTAAAEADGANHLIAQGAYLFAHDHDLHEGVGPLFNGQACASCHNSPIAGGMGTDPTTFVVRIARRAGGQLLNVQGGPVARQRSITELGGSCGLPTGVPPEANVTARRSAFTLRGSSLIDTILDVEILANQATEPAAVRGKANVSPDGRLGRFGWKAQTATLVEFISQAMRDEMGVTNPLSPHDNVDGCGANQVAPEADGTELTSLVAFLNTIDPPTPTAACLSSPGATVFTTIGCAGCHTPALRGPSSPTAAEIQVHLYSDLLVHDMGRDLDDGIVQGEAETGEFRTAPLWRVSDRKHFLHDGRATSLPEAIDAHGGQALKAKAAFDALNASDRQALLDFLKCL
jgi:CxxC motif-containing protein (DUF1111 family)